MFEGLELRDNAITSADLLCVINTQNETAADCGRFIMNSVLP